MYKYQEARDWLEEMYNSEQAHTEIEELALTQCIEAVNKQIPLVAVPYSAFKNAFGEDIVDRVYCPTCKYMFDLKIDGIISYCPKCGQRLYWRNKK